MATPSSITTSLPIYTLKDDGTFVPFPPTDMVPKLSFDKQAKISSYSFTAGRMGSSNIQATLMYPICLDDIWSGREFVEFRGEKYFILSTPTSSKSNDDIRYKHELNFTSERVMLDFTYFFDVVSPDAANVDQFVSNSTKFTFFGDIKEFVVRLNYSLKYSGLPYSVVIDEGITSEGKLMSFEDMYFSEVLQEIFNVYELPFYFVGKVIHIGFTSNAITRTFRYGFEKELLTITKTNANYKIVNRCTGTGSDENIPHYYPNDNDKGTVEAIAGDTNIGVKTADITITDQKLYREKVSLADKIEYREGTSFQYTQLYIDENLDYVYEGKVEGVASLGSHGVTGYKTAESTGYFYGLIETANEASITVSANFSGTYLCDIWTKENGGLFAGYQPFSKDFTEFRWTLEYQTANGVSWSTMSSGTGSKATGSFNAYPGKNKVRFRCTYTTPVYTAKWINWKSSHSSLSMSVESNANTRLWYNKDAVTSLSAIGISISKTPSIGDYFYQKQIVSDYIITSNKLMPPIYRSSMGGERFYNAKNDTYINPLTGEYYTFENVYTDNNPKEMIVSFDYIKPTIKNIKNAAGQLIGEILDVAFDDNDNDERNPENNEYEHGYFYIKLRKFDGSYGFNIFDQAIVGDDMTISMTSGNCAACKFVISVSENKTTGRKYNPVQVDDNGNIMPGGYSEKVNENNIIDRQQNTQANEVWVAVAKDYDTFGVAMPNNSRNYKPKKGDSFVLLNIDLPKPYILNAENELKEAIIQYLYTNNSEKFNFSINFSRIFFAKNMDILDKLDENARLQIEYNGKKYELYVSNYTYKVSSDSVLPEITVELSDTITVRKGSVQSSIDAVKQDIMSSIGSIDFLKMGLRYFIRKDIDDSAEGHITLKNGLYVTKKGEESDVQSITENDTDNVIQEGDVNAIQEYTGEDAIVNPDNLSLGDLTNTEAIVDNKAPTDVYLIKKAGSNVWSQEEKYLGYVQEAPYDENKYVRYHDSWYSIQLHDALPNPEKLIITGNIDVEPDAEGVKKVEYDGQVEVSVNIPSPIVDKELLAESVNPVQNKVIKAALDGKQAKGDYALKTDVTGLATVARTGSYNDLTNKPTIPTKLPNPNSLTFTGAVKGTYDGTSPISINIPTKAPNVGILKFAGAVTGSYDGSTDVTVTIPSGSGGGGSSIIVDNELSTTSLNPVQNKVVTAALSGKQDKGDYVLNSSLSTVAKSGKYEDLTGTPGIPVELPNPYKLVLSGAVNATYDGSTGKEVVFPTTYSNPYALTFTGAVSASYDGSKALTINIPSGGGGGSSITVDSVISSTSTNPVQNRVISAALAAKQPIGEYLLATQVSTAGKTGNYNDLTNKPTIPTVPSRLANPYAITFTGGATGTYDGSSALTINIPTGGGGSITVDSSLSDTSVNPVQNKVITGSLNYIAAAVSENMNKIATKQDKLVSGTDIKTINGQSILGSGNITITAPSFTIDSALSTTSTNAVQNKVITSRIDTLESQTQLAVQALNTLILNKQDKLVSGTSIKTINGQSVLGSGNISTPTVTVDDTLDSLSVNPVQNKVVKAEIDKLSLQLGMKQNTLVSGTSIKTINGISVLGSGNFTIPIITVDSAMSSTSTNPVQNKVINGQLQGFTLSLNNLQAKVDPINTAWINKNSTGGLVVLDNNGNIPTGLLPSYIDDVIDLRTFVTSNPTSGMILGWKYYNSTTKKIFQATSATTGLSFEPEEDKIYVRVDNSTTWRWSGSTMAQLNSGLTLGTTSSTAFRGDYGNTLYTNFGSGTNLTATQAARDAFANQKEYIASLSIISTTSGYEFTIETGKMGAAGSARRETIGIVGNKPGLMTPEMVTKLNSNLTLGTTSTTAFRGDYGNTLYSNFGSGTNLSNTQKARGYFGTVPDRYLFSDVTLSATSTQIQLGYVPINTITGIAKSTSTLVMPTASTTSAGVITAAMYNQFLNPTPAWSAITGKPSWIGTSKPTYSWSEIGSKPSTVSGYGITDVYTKIAGDNRYLWISGDTAKSSGTLSLSADLFTDNHIDGALNLRNSNITGVNAINFNSHSEEGLKGINFYRDSTHADTIVAQNGNLYFAANRTLGSTGTRAAVFTVSNYNTWVPTKTGTGASGTWGISITGTAASANAVAWSNVTSKPSWIGSSKPSYAWSEITSKPTTLSGYGITDAVNKSQILPEFVNGQDTVNVMSPRATKLLLDNGLSGKQDKLVSGTSIKTINGQSVLGSGNITVTAPGITVDSEMNVNSTNPVQNKVIVKTITDWMVTVANALATKEDVLVSGTNIKTINGTSILGSGNIATLQIGVGSSNAFRGDYGNMLYQDYGTGDNQVYTRIARDVMSKIDEGDAQLVTSMGVSVSATKADISYYVVGFDKVAATYTQSIPAATTSKAGVMTAADKTALVNVANQVNSLNTHKQDKLVSGTSIKTINGQSLLGSGNIAISGGSGGSATIHTLTTPNLFNEARTSVLSLNSSDFKIIKELLATEGINSAIVEYNGMIPHPETGMTMYSNIPVSIYWSGYEAGNQGVAMTYVNAAGRACLCMGIVTDTASLFAQARDTSNGLLEASSSFSGSSCYIQLSNGLLIQWGVITANSNSGVKSLTFPVSFTSATSYSVSFTPEQISESYMYTVGIWARNAGAMSYYTKNYNGTSFTGNNGIVAWIAIGI